MFKYSKETFEMVDIQTRYVYGTTVPEAHAEVEKIKVEAEHVKAEAEHVKAEAKHVKAEVERISEKLHETIIRLYVKLNMAIEEIGEITGQSPKEIKSILIAKKVIDK